MNIEKLIKEEIMRILLEDVEDDVRRALEAEGGAAGLDAIADGANVTSDEALAAMKEMDDVAQHEKGDYILGDGENVRVVTSVEEKKKKNRKREMGRTKGRENEYRRERETEKRQRQRKRKRKERERERERGRGTERHIRVDGTKFANELP